jgi:uncharacterized membrane protein
LEAGPSASVEDRAEQPANAARYVSARQTDPARLAALTDGVFAIIMTLLVLDIHVPDLKPGQSLADAMRELRPTLVAFVISFVLVGLYWVSHRDLFALIRRSDRNLVWLNILFMLPVTLLPFGSALLGRYEHEPRALELFGLVLLLIVVMRAWLWLYVSGTPDLLYVPIDPMTRRSGFLLASLPGLGFLAAILAATVSTTASLATFAAIPLLYYLGTSFLIRREHTLKEPTDFT